MDSIHFFVYEWHTVEVFKQKVRFMVTKLGHFTHNSCIPPWGGGDPATAAVRVHLYLLISIWFTHLANKSGILGSRAVEIASNEVRHTPVSPPHSGVAQPSIQLNTPTRTWNTEILHESLLTINLHDQKTYKFLWALRAGAWLDFSRKCHGAKGSIWQSGACSTFLEQSRYTIRRQNYTC